MIRKKILTWILRRRKRRREKYHVSMIEPLMLTGHKWLNLNIKQ
jgi:hypothetical protein